MTTEIIADASLNHLGDKRLIEAMIRAAKDAGIDAIKFQSWRADKLRKDYPDYQYHYQRHKSTELTHDHHLFIIETCKDYGIDWLTSTFDFETTEYLASIGLKRIKVASPDANNWPLLDKCFALFEHVIISTGMHTRKELELLIDYLYAKRKERFTLLHCTSIYPTSPEHLNLNTMRHYQELGFRAGLSDHTIGTSAGKLAISWGADILEKHFTLNRFMPGVFQEMAGLVEEFRELVEWRDGVEKMKGSVFNKLTQEQLERRKQYIGKWNG